MSRIYAPALAVLFLLPLESEAIIRRHDVPDSSYVISESTLPAVVDLLQPGDCLATLIHPHFLLTVAHCAEDVRTSRPLEIQGNDYQISQVIQYPGYVNHTEDIALIRLTTPVVGVAPIPLYRQTDEVGQELLLVGRGITATGQVGEMGGNTDGLLRQATNVVSQANDYWLEVLFDRTNTPGTTPLEGVGAGGDSGGPAFIQTASGLAIAGLNAWGDATPQSHLGRYDAQDYSTRVSSYLDWIDDTVAAIQNASP